MSGGGLLIFGAGGGGSGPSLLFQDTFTDADGTALESHVPNTGGTWIEQSGTDWIINSNRAQNQGGASGGQQSAAININQSNCFVEATIVVFGTGDGGLIGRAAGDLDYILVVIESGALILYRRVAGTFTNIGSFTGTISANDVIRLECNGANLVTVYQNGISRISVTETAGSTNTRWGIRENGTTPMEYDDFQIDLA